MARVGETLWVSDYPGGMRAVRDGVVAEESLSDEDLSVESRARMTERGEKTRLSVPLVYLDEVFGMMILIETERERRLTPDEVRMAQVIGEQAAASLHNARLHRREEDQHRWLAALAEATRVIGSRLNRSELLHDVAALATTALLVDRALVYEWDEHDAVFALRAADSGIVTVRDLADADAAIDDAVTAALRRGESVIQQRADVGHAPGPRLVWRRPASRSSPGCPSGWRTRSSARCESVSAQRIGRSAKTSCRSRGLSGSTPRSP